LRQFASSGFRLWNLGREAKILYTAFCALTLVGLVSSALYYAELSGTSLDGVTRYYRGTDGEARSTDPVATPPTGAGPEIDLPADPLETQAPIVVAVSFRKLLEVTHFHLFTMPVVLLIVGHLFLGTALSDRRKFLWIAGASVATTMHLATPWLVKYLGAPVALFHAVSGVALVVTMSVLTLYPVVVMWKPPTRRSSEGADPRPVQS
jgi:hypothetical protein